jgi:fumarate reductase flavoprotein subunit
MDYASIYDHWLNEYANGKCKAEIVKLFLDESGKTIDWLHFDHGFLFTSAMAGFGENVWPAKYQYVYYSNQERGQGLPEDATFFDRSTSVGKYFDHIVKDFTDAGGDYMLETECYELMYDTSGNKVTGIKARGYDGTEYIINADVVILAGGGFAGSTEMEEKYLGNDYYPLKGSWKLWGMAQNKGQMIQSAIDKGAATFNIEMVPCIHFTGTADIITKYPVYYRDGVDERMLEQNTWSLNDIPYYLGVSSSAMQVGKNGKRNYNEAGGFGEYFKGGPVWYTIYGSDYIDNLAANGFPGNVGTFTRSTKVWGFGGYRQGEPVPQIYEVLEAAVEKGFVYKSDTLELLAAKMEVPVSDFVAEVQKYKGFCAAGNDADFAKPTRNLVDNIKYGPYYAIKTCPTPYSTVAGLDINDKINVLNKNGSPMNGLYAVVTTAAVVLYAPDKPYAGYGGVALGWAFTSADWQV